MKKQIILLATLLMTGVALNAQVGIGTDEPKATLDVIAGTVVGEPDGVLVPRFEVDDLADKDAAYGEDQNGTLVFVTSTTAGSAGKTSNITGKGFHYYDHGTSKWVAVGGGSSSTAVYQNILGEAVTVSAASYNALATDFLIRTNHNAAVAITLPNADASNKGKMYAIFNNNSGASTVTVGSNSVLGTPTMSINRSKMFISDGANWVAITYN